MICSDLKYYKEDGQDWQKNIFLTRIIDYLVRRIVIFLNFFTIFIHSVLFIVFYSTTILAPLVVYQINLF